MADSLDFIKARVDHYDFRVPPVMVDGRDIAFRCRRLTADEWVEGMEEAANPIRLFDRVDRAGLLVLRQTLMAMVEWKIDEETGAEEEVVTPLNLVEKDDEGNVISGDFDIDDLRVELLREVTNQAYQQLFGNRELKVVDVGEELSGEDEPGETATD